MKFRMGRMVATVLCIVLCTTMFMTHTETTYAANEQQESNLQDMISQNGTCISKNREEGIAQIQTLITDYNFASAVYDSLSTVGHLGSQGQSVKEVIASFQGDIRASGYVQTSEYYVEFYLKIGDREIGPSTGGPMGSLEEAEEDLNGLKSEFGDMLIKERIYSKVIKTDKLKPDDQLIEDITGIEWLRKAKYIDLSANKIEDLTRLSIEYLKTLTPDVYGENTNGGKKWFGRVANNTWIDFRENPIKKCSSDMGGRIYLEAVQAAAFRIIIDEQVFIKEDSQNWKTGLDIKLPEILIDGKKMVIIKENPQTTFIKESETTIKDIVLDRTRLTDEVFPVKNIGSSGEIYVVVGGYDRFGSWAVAENVIDDSPTFGGVSLKYNFIQRVHLYSKIVVDSETSTDIYLSKTVANTDKPVKGAKFQLYKAENKDGTYTKGELYSEKVYETDETGKIKIEHALPSGDYCFVETEPPTDFVLDKSTITGFSIKGGTVSLTGGEPSVTPTGGSTVSSKENETFIDRYAPDVSVNVTPEEGFELEQIVITYFDRDTQGNKVVIVNTAEEASNWINKNKGNEKELGIIDGSVNLKAIFKQTVNLKVQNEREITDFTFQKISAVDKAPLSGVKFGLSCSHVHDEICGGMNASDQCSHAHNDLAGNVDANGCIWKAEAVSESNGLVSFKGLNTGIYILKEIETQDGYQLPVGTWDVTVDAGDDKVTVTVGKKFKGTDLPEFLLSGDSLSMYQVKNNEKETDPGKNNEKETDPGNNNEKETNPGNNNENSKFPQSGDSSSIALFALMMGLSGATLVVLGVKRKMFKQK